AKHSHSKQFQCTIRKFAIRAKTQRQDQIPSKRHRTKMVKPKLHRTKSPVRPKRSDASSQNGSGNSDHQNVRDDNARELLYDRVSVARGVRGRDDYRVPDRRVIRGHVDGMNRVRHAREVILRYRADEAMIRAPLPPDEMRLLFEKIIPNSLLQIPKMWRQKWEGKIINSSSSSFSPE